LSDAQSQSYITADSVGVGPPPGTRDHFFNYSLTFTGLLAALSDKWEGLSFNLLLGLASAVFLGCEYRGTHDNILLSDSSNLQGQIAVFLSPRNRVAQLLPTH
jgi:hypothetical protein